MSKSLLSACGMGTLMLCFGIIANSSMPAAAQQLTVNKPSLKSAPTPLTAQQTQIVNGMTSAQIQAYVNKIQPTLTKLKNDIAAHQQSTAIPNWQDFIRGTATTSSGQQVNAAATPTYNFTNSSGSAMTVMPQTLVGGAGPGRICPVYGCGGCKPPICGGGPPLHLFQDLDQDGLDDTFETNVADNFTPFYGSSAGEQDQFATLATTFR
jgi:hypothetical protein